MVCKRCGKEIKKDDEVIKLVRGTYIMDEIGGLGFEEAQSCSNFGLVHFECISLVDKLNKSLDRVEKGKFITRDGLGI